MHTDSSRIFAITHNVPGFLPTADTRLVARGESDAIDDMRAELDYLLDGYVESGIMSADDADIDMAHFDSARADGDLAYELHRSDSLTWTLPAELCSYVITAQAIDESDLDSEEREYLA